MGPYSVNLSFEYTPASVVVPSYRLEVTAASAQNLSHKIFVFRKTVASGNVFEGVATPEQLTTVPVDNPDVTSLYPTKFRTNIVEVANSDPDVVDEFNTDIRAAVARLTTSLTKADELSTVEDVTIGVLGYSHTSSSFLST